MRRSLWGWSEGAIAITTLQRGSGSTKEELRKYKDGTKFGEVAAAPATQLPPKGAPGIKGRRLRHFAQLALDTFRSDQETALQILRSSIAEFDQNDR
jgi:hypothetical protein